MNDKGYSCRFCNSYNDILTHYCKNCKALQSIVSTELQSLVSLERTGEFYPMDNDRYEKHTEYFNSETIVVSQMTDEQLEVHIKKLSAICFEGRAKLNASEAEKRKRRAKLSPEQREWLVNADDESVSDALAAVKVRKDRMSKADKLKEAMSSLGLADVDVAALMGSVQKTATETSINKITYTKKNGSSQIISELCRTEVHEACPGSFHSDGKSNKCECKCHTTVSKWDEVETKPIDSSIEDLFK